MWNSSEGINGSKDSMPRLGRTWHNGIRIRGSLLRVPKVSFSSDSMDAICKRATMKGQVLAEINVACGSTILFMTIIVSSSNHRGSDTFGKRANEILVKKGISSMDIITKTCQALSCVL